ncbi:MULTISPECIES: hypothetical protein [Vibrio]|uniref:Uncharacterized protein n=2 Tax=Vibrio TaxID=662 RepID=A0A1M5ZMJ4_9VIBR|nr:MULTISPECIES: hypothetical protein [Vibrio]SHI25394.1 hypothetical protein VA7868_02941 [Vibrio aerogenes CECT 7868]SHO54466.1 hypothetical protein VQ7734_00180 [Vibrio quintilis]
MVNKRKLHDSVNCDIPQEKEAFKNAYRIIKTIYKPALKLDPNQFDDFNHAVTSVLEHMPFKHFDFFEAAIKAFEAREDIYHSTSRLEHYLSQHAIRELQEELSA